MYDNSNVFAKILRGELSSDIINQNESFICIKDINPITKKHYLVIPKNPFVDLTDFNKNASNDLKLELFKFIQQTIDKADIKQYKLQTNNGHRAGQVVFHLHFHIISYDD